MGPQFYTPATFLSKTNPMSMSSPEEPELSAGESPETELDHYFRTVPTADGEALEVGLVQWDSPYEPRTEWHLFRAWQGSPSPEQLEQARVDAIPKYFRLCKRCRTLCNKGQMHDADTCHGCAERYLGVVH